MTRLNALPTPQGRIHSFKSVGTNHGEGEERGAEGGN